MLVKVKYFKEDLSLYGGYEYTFRTDLPLKMYQKVLVPSMDGENKKALVVAVNVPETELDPSWAWKLKDITKLDKGV